MPIAVPLGSPVLKVVWSIMGSDFMKEFDTKLGRSTWNLTCQRPLGRKLHFSKHIAHMTIEDIKDLKMKMYDFLFEHDKCMAQVVNGSGLFISWMMPGASGSSVEVMGNIFR